ncbi:hypothetical protein D3C86_2233360 [compost metagenome]
MQSCQLVLISLNSLHEVRLHQIAMFTNSRLKIGENNALLFQFFGHLVEHDTGVALYDQILGIRQAFGHFRQCIK